MEMVKDGERREKVGSIMDGREIGKGEGGWMDREGWRRKRWGWGIDEEGGVIDGEEGEVGEKGDQKVWDEDII